MWVLKAMKLHFCHNQMKIYRMNDGYLTDVSGQRCTPGVPPSALVARHLFLMDFVRFRMDDLDLIKCYINSTLHQIALSQTLLMPALPECKVLKSWTAGCQHLTTASNYKYGQKIGSCMSLVLVVFSKMVNMRY